MPRRRKREGDMGDLFGHARLNVVPQIQLADENQARLGVLDDVLGRVRVHRWVERDGDMPRHPDGQFGHDEVRAVLADNGDAAARLEIERLQVGRHAPCFSDDLRPRVVRDSAVAERLGQIDFPTALLLVLIHVFEELLAHDGSVKFSAAH